MKTLSYVCTRVIRVSIRVGAASGMLDLDSKIAEQKVNSEIHEYSTCWPFSLLEELFEK